ncbi:BamA/OMP85 family outer membrane protein [Sphingopyxis sp.]|uniref:BamA/OMP85 family outer membrane protein n=1 Tax=Sphingopyxis sp. TaxID=1908224 RepID=UPI003BAAEC95
MQGTALGVAAGCGLSDNATIEAPEPAILEPTPRRKRWSRRKSPLAIEIPMTASAAVRDPDADLSARAVGGLIAMGGEAAPATDGDGPVSLARTDALALGVSNFALPFASPTRGAPTAIESPEPLLLGTGGGHDTSSSDVSGTPADASAVGSALAHADNAANSSAMTIFGDALDVEMIAAAPPRRQALLALADLGQRMGAPTAAMAPAKDETATADVGADAGGAGAEGLEADPASGQAKEGDLLTLQTLSRGGLAVSGGYSSIEGPVGSVKLSRTNIGKPGRDITLSGRYSKVQALMELGASDTNFAGSGFAIAPTFFYSRSKAVGFDDDVNSSLFVQTARGGNFYLGRPLKRGLRFAANYRYSDEDFVIRRKNAACDASVHGSVFCNALGHSTGSVLSLALSLDRRDSALDPKRGFQLRVSQDIAGPGGTTRFVRYRAGGTYYRRLSGNIDLSAGLEGGYMKGYDGRDVPLFDRFYIGGNTMRGFDLRGLGPKVVPVGAAPGQATAIGGRAYYVGRVELSFHLSGDVNRFAVTPSIFVDAGSVFGARKSELAPGEALIGNSATPRVAVGLGLSFNVAPGKLRFNVAQPVKRQNGDRSKILSISFGTAF